MKIDFENHNVDLQVAKLGRAGRAAWAIAEKTGLTISQVRTRLTKAGIRLSFYRNSLDDWFTRRILTLADDSRIEDRIRQDIRYEIRQRLLLTAQKPKEKRRVLTNR